MRKGSEASDADSPDGDTTGRKKLLRGRLLEEAARLFSVHGFAGTTLQDVADSLGLTRAALYYYFPSKEALLAALVQETTRHFEDIHAAVARRRFDTVSERMHALVFEMVVGLIEKKDMFRLTDRSEEELSDGLRQRHEESKRRILDSLRTIIRAGMESGEFRAVHPTLVAFGFTGMMNWAAWWYDPEGELTPQDVASAYADLIIAALRRDLDRDERQPYDLIRSIREDLDLLALRVQGNDNKKGAERKK